jgi:two-component system KDP operon response regulator KdpE
VRAALRRSSTGPKGPLPPFRAGGLAVDFGRRDVRVDGRPVRLTAKEYELLAYLARNAGKVLTYRQILQAVWGPEYGDEAHYVWTYVRRLRRKLEAESERPQYLLTIVNAGYRLRAPDEDPAGDAR